MRDLSLHLLDLIENSVRAQATLVQLTVAQDSGRDRLTIALEDDGIGLHDQTTDQATDPFFTTKPGKHVGLGLSLFRATAEAAGGRLWIENSPLGGAAIRAEMRPHHVDMLPFGDIAATISSIVLTNPELDVCCSFSCDGKSGQVRVSEIREALPSGLASAFAVSRRVHEQIDRCVSALWGSAVPTLSTKEESMNEVQTHCTCQEQASEAELMARLDDVLEEYRGKAGALIPVLQIAQGIFGYLPEQVIKHIARALDKPYSEVAGVVGFYSFFSTQPRGKHVVRVCLGTACYVRGGKQVLAAMKHKLGIDVGQTTADRQFSLEVARCFGACGLAPAIMIDETVHQRVKPAKLGDIIKSYKD